MGGFALPAIGAVTSIIGGIQGRSAARNAARAQERAALEAGGIVQDATNEFAPRILDMAEHAGEWVVDAGESAAQGVEGATGQANALLQQLFEQYLNENAPYREAGAGAVTQLSQLLSPEGEFNQKFQFDPNEDPGYQFRMDEGMKALERSASARGVMASGGTLKGMTRYAQGVASQEYGAAFDRFQKDRAARFGMLRDLTGVGEGAVTRDLAATSDYGARTSANTIGAAEYGGNMRVGTTQYAGDVNRDAVTRFVGANLDSARYRGDTRMGIGDAQAAGHIGAANAWNGMLGGIGQAANEIGGYFQLRDLLRTPRTVNVRSAQGGGSDWSQYYDPDGSQG